MRTRRTITFNALFGERDVELVEPDPALMQAVPAAAYAYNEDVMSQQYPAHHAVYDLMREMDLDYD